MKKTTLLLTLLSLFSTASLSAQTGDGAAAAAVKAKDSNWKGWAFVGGAIVAAAVGITVVMLNQGSSTSH